MKNFWIAICLMLFGATAGFAAERTLEWDASEGTDLSGYNMYKTVDPDAGPWVKMNTDGLIIETTYIFMEVEGESRQFYAVTAVNPWKQSGRSNIVTAPPGKPNNVHMVIDGSVYLHVNGPVIIEQ